DLCEQILKEQRPIMKVIAAELPEFVSKNGRSIVLPYDFYGDDDVRHRVIYVEASRGCPFKCEFCLSSLDVPVRNVPLDTFLPAMQRLLDRGVRRISRRQDNQLLSDNLKFLREQTGVHVHADLIVGLPGEDLGSFASGFDRL